MTKAEIETRLAYWKSLLEKLYTAYVALVEGNVKSYTIDDRSLTRLDISDLMDEIDAVEDKIAELEALLAGRRPRAAFGVIPRDI
ncbi:MAG: DUF6148 family protein [Oscillospiraceae bacterium]|nr:DUF6148 family protein [Oscillospiraceae bacterium]